MAMRSYLVASILTISTLLSIVVSDSACSIVGVHPKDCTKYESAERNFRCDGNAPLSAKWINDDYCDCPETGIDEPGTNACNKGRFYCRNAGFKGEYIYSSWVNDGVCDCCDGSDEWNGLHNVQCPNRCQQMAEEALIELREKETLYLSGLKTKATLIKYGNNQLSEKLKSKQSLQSQIDEKQQIVNLANAKKEELEEKERVYREELTAKREAEAAERAAQQQEEATDKAEDTVDASSTTEDESAPSAGVDTSEDVSSDEPKELDEEFPYPDQYRPPEETEKSGDESSSVSSSSAASEKIDDDTAKAREKVSKSDRLKRRRERRREAAKTRKRVREEKAEQRRKEENVATHREERNAKRLARQRRRKERKKGNPLPSFLHKKKRKSMKPQDTTEQVSVDVDGDTEEFPYPDEYRYKDEDDDSPPQPEDDFDWSEFDDEEDLYDEEYLESIREYDDAIPEEEEISDPLLDQYSDDDDDDDDDLDDDTIWDTIVDLWNDIIISPLYDAYATIFNGDVSSVSKSKRDRKKERRKSRKQHSNVETPFSKAAREARDEWKDLKNGLNDLENELKDVNTFLEIDFGANNRYASLFDQCFSTDIQKYTYELCPFKEVFQKEKHSSVKLGKYDNFDYNSRPIIMKFDHGQSCWKGPQRSIAVSFECFSRNEVVSVSEPSTCTYTMIFRSPLACFEEDLKEIQYQIENQFKDQL